LNVNYGDEFFGSTYFYNFINTRVKVVSRPSFEYYLKLSLGATIYTHDIKALSDHQRKFFPGRVNFSTGVTIVGLNFFHGNKWGANIELSVLSPELISLGLTYRFWQGYLPNILGKVDGYKAM